MHRFRSLILLPALLLLTCGVFPAKSEADFSAAEIILKKAIEDRAFPGCSVVVGTDSRILWSKSFGRFDYNGGAPVTKKTIYDLASVTKVAGTTSVFMRLVAEGKVSVKDPVSKYVPEFIEGAASPEEKGWREQILIEHLLTHTSGLTSWKPFYRSLNSYTNLLQAILQTPLDSAPGAKYRYSDPGMILLGEIAGRAGGRPLMALEQELVFKPLKMKNTLRNPAANLLNRIPPTEKWPDKETFVHGVVHDENARAGEGLTGHAGLFSTAEDLARLAQELLRASEGRSKLFPHRVASEFFKEAEISTNLQRTLGWGIDRRVHAGGKTSRVLSHTGFTGTSIRIDLDERLFFVLLSNRVHPSRDNEKIGRVRRELSEAVYRAVEPPAPR